MPKKISIIIPIYNGEKFIRRCLDSVLDQTFTEFEILAIDDGSTDDSLEVLREYEKKYPEQVRAFTQENRGVAKTRNRGIELTETKYLMFVDQDDFIDPDFCEKYYTAAEAGGYDVVLGGFKRPGTGRTVVNKYVALKDTPYAKYMCTGLWAKLHNTAFIKSNNITVFDSAYGEDIAFTLNEYSKTKNIKIIEGYVGYNWFYNSASVSNTSHKKMLDTLPHHIALLDKAKQYDDESDEHEYYILQEVIFFLLWSGRSAERKDFLYVYQEVFSWLAANYPNATRNKYVRLGPSGSSMLTRASISIFIFLHSIHAVAIFTHIYCRGK